MPYRTTTAGIENRASQPTSHTHDEGTLETSWHVAPAYKALGWIENPGTKHTSVSEHSPSSMHQKQQKSQKRVRFNFRRTHINQKPFDWASIRAHFLLLNRYNYRATVIRKYEKHSEKTRVYSVFLRER
jgi:hypothetical protein